MSRNDKVYEGVKCWLCKSRFFCGAEEIKLFHITESLQERLCARLIDWLVGLKENARWMEEEKVLQRGGKGYGLANAT